MFEGFAFNKHTLGLNCKYILKAIIFFFENDTLPNHCETLDGAVIAVQEFIEQSTNKPVSFRHYFSMIYI